MSRARVSNLRGADIDRSRSKSERRVSFFFSVKIVSRSQTVLLIYRSMADLKIKSENEETRGGRRNR